VPAEFKVDDRMIIAPPPEGEHVDVVRGPNIKPLPRGEPLPETLRASVVLKVADDVTTDHIMPAGSKLLPLRSNIPAMAEHVFEQVDADFARRAKDAGSSIVVGGSNYGQGSSREHAALAPMYLGLRAVLAKSFSRIHRANLVNVGILPLVFVDEADYDRIQQGDELEIPQARAAVERGEIVRIRNRTRGYEFEARHGLSANQAAVLLAGGRLSYVKSLQG
jgi:aconitate hydratase